MASISMQRVSKSFGGTAVVQNLDLTVADGEFLTVLGASGSGKTTCLRMIAGFVMPSSGRIYIGDKDVTALPPYKRNAGVVFQQYALFPHLTIEENVAFGLKLRKLDAESRRRRVRDALERVGLATHARHYPHQLSGGQKQRVALARAVVVEPEILLLDEPLSALDAKLRAELRSEIRNLQRKLGITTIFVTHDQDEALALSDRIAVMCDGHMVQIATPTTLYQRPADLYVAEFVGRINVFRGQIVSTGANRSHYRVRLLQCPDAEIDIPAGENDSFGSGDACMVCFRPEDGVLADASTALLRANVEKVEYIGDGWNLSCSCASTPRLDISLAARGFVPKVGETIGVTWNSDASILLRAS